MNKYPEASRAFALICTVVVAGVGGQTARAQSLVIEEVDSPARSASGQPNLYGSADGKVYLSWLEAAGESRQALRFAVFEGRRWSEPRTIVERDDLLANPANFPSIIALPGALVTHWPTKGPPGTHASGIRVASSTDEGESWSRPVTPHSDRSMVQHGFVSLLPWSNGRVLAVWLDGRSMKRQLIGGHGPAAGGTNLRYTTIGTNGEISEDELIDSRVCDCCQTSAALTSEGALVVYRGRSDEELRDISVVRFSRGGWSEPRLVNRDGWRIHGCPINGPSVAAEGRQVAVAWFTAANDAPRVNVAFSRDAGTTFGQPIRVDDSSPAGRVDVSMLSDGSALVSWLERMADGNELRVRRIHPDGSRDRSATLPASSGSEVTGFTQIARAGKHIVLAWTQSGKVRTALMKTSNR